MLSNVSCDDVLRTEGFDNNYICDCPSTWNGPYCETDVNECDASPCRTQQVSTVDDDFFKCFFQNLINIYMLTCIYLINIYFELCGISQYYAVFLYFVSDLNCYNY